MLNITNLSEYNLENSKNIIIVPETFSHNYERFLCEKYTNEASKNTEVLTFSRISDRIFAEIGGFANNYINESGRILAMYNAINMVFSELKVYNSNKIEIITKILATIDEFKMYKIEENDLLLASKELSGNLKNKVMDLYYIYCAYNKITSNEIRDPREEIEFLVQNFHKCTIYNDYNIYFDKFDGFTPQQYAFLVEILRKNINVTVSLELKEQGGKLYDLSATSRETLDKLKFICHKHDFKYKTNFFDKEKKKFEDITENLFEYDEISMKNEDVSLHISTTTQNECMYVAGKIIEIISKSSDIRFSDVVVTARNFQEYQEQLRVAFERYNIPLFVSKKDDITIKPPIKLIISALNIILSRYKTQSIFEYLKSPMIYTEHKKICTLEDYVLRWNIKYITKKLVFTANPSYNLRKVNENEQKQLNWLNKFKNDMLKPIFELEESFKNCENGEDFINQLYSFCEKIKLGFKIVHFETEDVNLKQQYDQLWDAIVDSFDQFFEISGHQKMDTEEFIKLYKTLISSYSVAEIPSSIDNVSAGGFERIVGEKCKILFVLGADADNLPCKVAENPILNDDDREELENLDLENVDLEMSPFGNDLIVREFELIANVFNLPTGKLFVSFCEVSMNNNAPSGIFKRIRDIVSDVKITTDNSVNFNFMYMSPKTALENLAVNKYTDKIKSISPDLIKNAHKNILDKEIIEKIYSKNISPSRIDVQTSCRFRYFMQYGLKAKSRKVVSFNQAENGNFIHYILEQVIGKSDYNSDQLDKKISEYIEIYAQEHFSENMFNDPKFAYIFNNLNKNTHKIVKNIISEINDSEFKPHDFELEIGEKNLVKPLKIGDFSIIGKVDRVDLYKEGEKDFLRIIDYKSGVKKLDLSTFYYGINMQMFIYMLALENDQNYFKEPSAYGALYVPTKIPKISVDMPISNDKIEKKINDNLKRSGMLLEDKKIIKKMEKNIPFVYLPIKLNKDESFSKVSTAVASSQHFSDMKKFVQKKLIEITDDFSAGETEPNPYVYDKRSPCDYCDFTSCCGFSTSYDVKRTIEKLKDDEFWEKIEG